jgi:hypothetical protein
VLYDSDGWMDGWFGDVLDWKRTTQLNNQSHPCLLGVIFLNQRGRIWDILIFKANIIRAVFISEFEIFCQLKPCLKK